MANKYTFERTEYKYILSEEQYQRLMEWLDGYAKIDAYGKTNINNIYYDMPEYTLIRKSLQKPVYKEKLRLRSYGLATESSPTFIELKKKYMGIVYKRRMELPYGQAVAYLAGDGEGVADSQIRREIDYFLKKNNTIAPRMKISYDRIALAGVRDPELRLTFDENIRYSTDQLTLTRENTGRQILGMGYHLLEIKIPGAMPIELSEALSELGIFKTSFSKYGRAFEMMVADRVKARRSVRVPELVELPAAGLAYVS